MGLKILSTGLKIDLSREVKCPLRIVLFEESPYNLINVLGPFSVILQPLDLHEVEFTDTSSAGKARGKSSKYSDLSAFNWD